MSDWGFLRAGSMILNVRASARLSPPAISGSRALGLHAAGEVERGQRREALQDRPKFDLLVEPL